MKKILSSAFFLSLAFFFQSASAFDLYYPTATPHLINKGNMASNTANPYIGKQKLVSFSYGFVSLAESSNLDSLSGNTMSLSGDLPLGEELSLFGSESVISFGYFNSQTTSKTALTEYDEEHSTMALQLSSKFGEKIKGSVRLRMENADHHGETSSYSEFDLGLNYTLENHCEIGAHISPKSDSTSKDVVQAGFGCLLSPTLAVGADVAQLTKGEKDSENGLVLSADYLYSPNIDVELILNVYETERNLELSLSYLVDSWLWRASLVAINEKDEHEESFMAQGLLFGVAGYF